MRAAGVLAMGGPLPARPFNADRLRFADVAPRAPAMTTRSDAANARLMPLLLAARAGDASAYNALLIELAALLRPFVRRHLARHRCDIEDVLQDVLLAIHVHRESYDAARQPITAWIYAIARYKVIDHLRREGVRVHAPIDGVEGLFAPETADAGDAHRDLDKLVAQLPDQQQTAVRLTKIEEYSVREAAAASGMSETSIKVNVHRAIKNLMRFAARDGKA